ncbi:MAG: DUF3857 domain-containing transglutaminase family protein [Marinilabiliales bacterium]|nr:DUF3857 domain-containing transglutaminase family protein [Marinilabiliales bacterium]
MNFFRLTYPILLLCIFSLPTSVRSQDCVVLKNATHYRLEGGDLEITDSILILVNRREGERLTEISLPYSKNQKISKVNGWIALTDGKQIRELQSKDIKETNQFSEGSLYEDRFVKKFQLKYNVYPYIIGYTYRLKLDQFTVLTDWTPVLDPEIPTLDGHVTVTLPTRTRYREVYSHLRKSRLDSTSDHVTFRYDTKFDGLPEKEAFSPSPEDLVPRLILVPESFFYGIKGQAQSWRELGNWFYLLNQDLLTLDKPEQEEVLQLISGTTEKREIIHRLYHYLQDHTRYINVSVGIGGLKSYPATYVSRNRFGDCKALSNYFKALLSVAGIASHFVLVNRDPIPAIFRKEIPSLQFNHVLLAVPLERDTIWIENTENAEPFNYVGVSTQNRTGLWIDPSDSKLVQLPSLAESTVRVERNMDVTCQRDQSAKVRLTFRFRGQEYEAFNWMHVNANQSDKEEYVKNYMPFANYEVADWKLEKSSRDSASIDLSADLKLSGFLRKMGSEFYFSTFPILPLFFSDPSQRKNALYFPYPIVRQDSVTYHLQESWHMRLYPANQTLSTKFGKYQVSAKIQGETLWLSRKLWIYPGYWPLSAYKEFYEFTKSVKTTEQIIVTPPK